jgi:hypothetical protein
MNFITTIRTLSNGKYDAEKTAHNIIFMIKGVSFGIQAFALCPAPSRADNWVVLNPLSS